MSTNADVITEHHSQQSNDAVIDTANDTVFDTFDNFDNFAKPDRARARLFTTSTFVKIVKNGGKRCKKRQKASESPLSAV